MATRSSGKKSVTRSKKIARRNETASKASRLADDGIATGADFSRVMAALLADVVGGRIEPNRANAACNVAGKLIRMVEMQHRYGKRVEGTENRLLELTPIAPQPESVQ